jgi:prepilin-type N-terminal cleavage/methylation domain-containing protein
MRRATGFTLIEMLAVIVLLGIVVSAATSFFFQMSSQSNTAAEGTRTTRRSAAVLDRVARELEGSVLVRKPDSVDPLEHPWVFFAERDAGGEGADRLRFVTRAHRSRASAQHESDLAVVTYAFVPDEEGRGQILRSLTPQLPEALDRTVPDREEDGAQVLIEDVYAFGVRFLSEGGEWKETWDTSTLESNQLPVAVEIQLALATPRDDDGAFLYEPETLRRQVVIPVRPLDFETLLVPEALRGGGEGEEDEEGEDQDGDGQPDDTTASADDPEEEDEELVCVTVSQCIARHPEIDVGAALDANGLPRSFINTIGGQCAGAYTSFLPLPGDCQ